MTDDHDVAALSARLNALERDMRDLRDSVELALSPWRALNTIGKAVRWLGALIALFAAIVGLVKFGAMEPPR